LADWQENGRLLHRWLECDEGAGQEFWFRRRYFFYFRDEMALPRARTAAQLCRVTLNERELESLANWALWDIMTLLKPPTEGTP